MKGEKFMELTLDIFQTMALASIVFYLGKYLKVKIPILSKYCIPAPVIGGLIFAILMLIFRVTGFATINLDVTLQICGSF